jgi:glycosyltransferase involved in cell wall biosynthesis
VREKNLLTLVDAYANYRDEVGAGAAWDLVRCGGGPEAEAIRARISDHRIEPYVHLPGFLQVEALPRWLANASAFVHPSLMEPWGLVVNEAAACSLPLLVSDRAGSVETFVPGDRSTGRRLDPNSVEQMANALVWMTTRTDSERWNMGRTAYEIAREWGPARFAQATLDALEIAMSHVARGWPRARSSSTLHSSSL